MVLDDRLCGLYRNSDQAQLQALPLLGVHVEVQVVDTVAEVQVLQFYHNDSFTEDAQYIFPLDPMAAVCDFRVEINGRILKGTVEAKEEARAIYDAAVQSGTGAYLLERNAHSDDLFRVSVGSLPEWTRVSVKISYVVELKVIENVDDDFAGVVEFVLPTNVAPRYTPVDFWKRVVPEYKWYSAFADQMHWDRYLAQDVWTANSIAARREPYPLSLYLQANMPTPISEVSSPSHSVQVFLNSDKKEARVMFLQDHEKMDREVILRFRLTDPNIPRAVLEVGELGVCEVSGSSTKSAGASNGAAIMLTIVPRFKLDDIAAEFIFVVDRSGSMSGSKIESVKNALQLFLRGLPTGSLFNLVSFGSNYEALFPEGSSSYTESSLRDASEYISSMSANFGGTEIMAPLRYIYDRMPDRKGWLRQIFLLTDGEVSNVKEVIGLVQNSHEAHPDWRLFTIGVGAGASRALVQGAAKAGRGLDVFINDGDRIEPVVMNQLKMALQPALTDLSIDWSGNETLEMKVVQAPSRLPPVFNGKRFVAYVLIEDPTRVPTYLSLKAMSPDGPLSLTLPLERSEGAIIQRLAARTRIADLEASRLAHNEIVTLGKKYRLVSSRTSFIVVDDRPIATGTKPIISCNMPPEPIRIIERSLDAVTAMMQTNIERVLSRGEYIESVSMRADELKCQSQMFQRKSRDNPLQWWSSLTNWASNIWGTLTAPAPPPTPPPAPIQTPPIATVPSPSDSNRISTGAPAGSQDSKARFIQDLILHQSFKGSFSPSKELATLLELANPENLIHTHSLHDGSKVEPEVFITVVVLAVLEARYMEFRNDWELLAEKARRWLHLQSSIPLEKLFEEAKGLL